MWCRGSMGCLGAAATGARFLDGLVRDGAGTRCGMRAAMAEFRAPTGESEAEMAALRARGEPRVSRSGLNERKTRI